MDTNPITEEDQPQEQDQDVTNVIPFQPPQPTSSASPVPTERVFPPSYQRPTWWNTVEQNSASAGVDSDVLWRISGAESAHGQNAGKAPTSGAIGPFQIIQSTWDGVARAHPDLALTNRTDPEQQARAAPWLLRAKNAVIEANIGRKPNAAESYLGWFVGEGDASKVLRADPSTPIGDLVRPASIQSNASVFSRVRTAGDLIQWSANKMNAGGGAYRNTVPQDASDAPLPESNVNNSTAGPVGSQTLEEAARLQHERDQDTYSHSMAFVEAVKK